MISRLTPFEKREKFRKPSKIDLKKLSRSCEIVNEKIDVSHYQCNDITLVNDLTYAFAITAIEHANLRKKCIASNKVTAKKTQAWVKRIDNQILELRKEISQLEQMNANNPSPKMRRNNERLKRKHNITNERERKLTCERIKQKLLAKNNRLKRYKQRSKQYTENRDFVNSPDRFYQSLRGTSIPIDKTPTKTEIEDFWRPILGTESNYNDRAPWIAEYESTIDIQPYDFEPITKDEITEAIKSFSNWKSPGIDSLQNFWWSKFESIYEYKVHVFNQMMDNPHSIPEWFTTGRTTLIPKKLQTEIPSNYRPVTCLPITYKIMTSIITQRMKTHLTTFNLIPEEQKGGISGNQGTVDQLLIDNLILENARKSKRNLSTAWIDYRKAFDSVPHDWLRRSLQIHKFPEKLINFFATTMTKWKTTLNITTQTETISSDPIQIQNGIFQGDCPSGLNFVISLLPLSWLIKRSSIGYAIGPRNNRTVISHLLFMDDLKLYANCKERLQDLLEIVSMFSDDICMKFGLDKCNVLNIRKGKLTQMNDITLLSGETIKALDLRDQYKYLGMLQSNEIDKKNIKDKFRTEYFERVKKILKSSLNSKNTIQAINTYAVPSLSYGFVVLDWSITELECIDRQTRNILRQYHMLHLNSDVERVYISRKNGGRGLLNITDLYKNQIINYSTYLKNSTEHLMTLVSTSQTSRGSKSIHQKAETYLRELQIDEDQTNQLNNQQLKSRIKTLRTNHKVGILKTKPMHGQYFNTLDQPHIDKTVSLSWLRSSTLKRTTESTICAIQENAITTKYTKKHIHKTSNDDTCRACKNKPETIHHVISGCPVLAPTKYTQRHDNVCRYIHLLLAEKNSFIEPNTTKWYQYDPEPILENDTCKILWNFPVQTDRRISHNKPDIITIDKRTREIQLIDIAIPLDSNIAQKRNEKITKYVDLSLEVKQLWNAQKVYTVPIVIGALGSIHENFQKFIEEKINFKINVNEMQKIVLLGTSNISRYFFSADF